MIAEYIGLIIYYSAITLYVSDPLEMYLGFEKIAEDGSTVDGCDISGKLHNVTALTSGVVGNAMYVNGVDQWVTFGSHKDRCFGNVTLCDEGFSLAFWVKLGARNITSRCNCILNSIELRYANGFEVCWTKHGALRASVTFTRGTYSVQTDGVHSHIWYHIGMTWNNATGLILLLDGTFHRNISEMTLDLTPEWPHETEVTLGALARDPTNLRYILTLTVDELYFWEKWMTNLAMWKVYAKSTFWG